MSQFIWNISEFLSYSNFNRKFKNLYIIIFNPNIIEVSGAKILHTEEMWKTIKYRQLCTYILFSRMLFENHLCKNDMSYATIQYINTLLY